MRRPKSRPARRASETREAQRSRRLWGSRGMGTVLGVDLNAVDMRDPPELHVFMARHKSSTWATASSKLKLHARSSRRKVG